MRNEEELALAADDAAGNYPLITDELIARSSIVDANRNKVELSCWNDSTLCSTIPLIGRISSLTPGAVMPEEHSWL